MIEAGGAQVQDQPGGRQGRRERERERENKIYITSNPTEYRL
jgi:hypothetical protein